MGDKFHWRVLLQNKQYMRLFNVKTITLMLMIFYSQFISTQNTDQSLRGTVKDQITNQPLAYVNVILSDSIIAATNEDGIFRFDQLKLGRYKLMLQYVGFEDAILPNIIINAGKETVLNITMQESIEKLQEIVVSAKKEKSKPLNEMSLISTRMVSVEETQRYAASFGDPARMANSFAGVVQTDAGNNHIAIRGNAPNGLLWRLEGIEIPNPNHFSYVSTSGGGISILSSQLLANSDFSTGAFAAEYGNALSGVFDIKLRKGNDEHREHTFQIGAIGIDLASEGPIKKGSSSYLINYRYSTLGLISKIVDVGPGITTFQDLSYNLSFKNKKWGDITFFGINGLSTQTSNDTTYHSNFKFVANTFVNGMTHTKSLNNNSLLRTAFVISNTTNDLLVKEIDTLYQQTEYASYKEHHQHDNITLSTKFQQKISAQITLKLGLIHTSRLYQLNQNRQISATENQQILYAEKGSNGLTQFYGQGQIRPTSKLTANLGFHFMYLWLNKTNSIEPRLAFNYSLNDQNSFSIGYGLHSQVLPTAIYFVQIPKNDVYTKVNENLKMSKAHHVVASYSYQPTSILNVKMETYYQYLFDIPVGTVASENYSLINLEFGTPIQELVNKGVGRNYGAELTVERYFSKGMYFSFANSLYDSKYKGTDGNWYNTRFNGHFTSTFTGGKEINISKNKSLAINIKTIYTGGLRQSPINLEKSIENGNVIFDYSHPFKEQNDNYFRTDIKLTLKRNYKHLTSSLVFDIQNVTNRKNDGGDSYNPQSKKIEKYEQVGLLPIISYKLEF